MAAARRLPLGGPGRAGSTAQGRAARPGRAGRRDDADDALANDRRGAGGASGNATARGGGLRRAPKGRRGNEWKGGRQQLGSSGGSGQWQARRTVSASICKGIGGFDSRWLGSLPIRVHVPCPA